jgi:hypothetical protein
MQTTGLCSVPDTRCKKQKLIDNRANDDDDDDEMGQAAAAAPSMHKTLTIIIYL